MSYILQKKIANSFQKLVEKNGFDHVSVTILMKETGIRRPTFYEYFQDKYDLLAWHIDDTLTDIIENNIGYLPWREIISLTFFEFDAYRRFYKNCVQEQHEIDLAAKISIHLQIMIDQLPAKQATTAKKNAAWLQLLTLGSGQAIVHNLLSEHPVDYEILVQQTIQALETTTV